MNFETCKLLIFSTSSGIHILYLYSSSLSLIYLPFPQLLLEFWKRQITSQFLSQIVQQGNSLTVKTCNRGHQPCLRHGQWRLIMNLLTRWCGILLIKCLTSLWLPEISQFPWHPAICTYLAVLPVMFVSLLPWQTKAWVLPGGVFLPPPDDDTRKDCREYYIPKSVYTYLHIFPWLLLIPVGWKAAVGLLSCFSILSMTIVLEALTVRPLNLKNYFVFSQVFLYFPLVFLSRITHHDDCHIICIILCHSIL